jgi:hypothetical protein
MRILCASPTPILKILLPKILFILFDKLLYSKLFLEIPGSWCHCAGIFEQSMGARNREEWGCCTWLAARQHWLADRYDYSVPTRFLLGT